MFFCPGTEAPMSAQRWTLSGQVAVPWLDTVAPLEPPTRSFRMVVMVSSSAWETGVCVS